MAAFRVSLGLLLVVDLLLRSRNLAAFYTDAGVLPRAALSEQYPTLSRFSIHALSGDAWFQALLFVLAGACALSLLVGYRTRIATLSSFVLLTSLYARNPGVLNGGDSLLWRLLLWSLFLPLEERWSLDALRRDGAPRRRVASLASAALLLQVVVMYTVNAAFKLRSDLWVGGDAVRYVLSLQQFTVLIGDSLAEFPTLLHAVDTAWMGMVLSSVFLILLRDRLRTAFVSLFVGMHLGMLLTLRLGLFPLVTLTALLVFLPASAWDRLVARLSNPVERSARRVGIDAALDGCRSRAQSSSAESSSFGASSLASLASAAAAGRRYAGRVAPAVVAALLAVMLVWNAIAVGLVAAPVTDSRLSPTDHTWTMFAPNPPTVDGWYAAPGTLESGERVDAFRESSVVGDERPATLAMYPSARWRKYLVGAVSPGHETLQAAFGDYLCRRWNGSHEDALTNVTVYYVEQPTRFDGPEPTRRVELVHRTCSTGE
ncbi:HTTM domain-containing protein [Halopelagius longus]|uniref:HTTM domain-containing protein n=1 Tax=Halopelagius longus TaxID=1236180 RepID=A0A370IU76_9EURY|nr:HTTM domain-containing protein [Halopelagius longus]